MMTSRCGVRFRLRDSSSSHGTKKWNMHQEDRQILPAVAGARDHVGNFFDQVRRERQQVLREVEVRPQHHEREHQLAEVVEVMRLEQTRHRLALEEERRDDDRERQRREPLPTHHQEPEDRRVPVRVERHDPVDARERDRQRVERPGRRRSAAGSAC